MNLILSPRELDVLRFIALGKTVGEISQELGCSPNTAKFHLGNIYRKLDVKTQAGAVGAGFRKGILT